MDGAVAHSASQHTPYSARKHSRHCQAQGSVSKLRPSSISFKIDADFVRVLGMTGSILRWLRKRGIGTTAQFCDQCRMFKVFCSATDLVCIQGIVNPVCKPVKAGSISSSLGVGCHEEEQLRSHAISVSSGCKRHWSIQAWHFCPQLPRGLR